MVNEPATMTAVWQEMRRRRVGKVIGVYLALAFAAAEAATYGVPLVDAPSWLLRAVLGAIVLGFPVAVVLAWTYDITPQGVVRTPDDTDVEVAAELTRHGWLLVIVLGVVVGGIFHVLRT